MRNDKIIVLFRNYFNVLYQFYYNTNALKLQLHFKESFIPAKLRQSVFLFALHSNICVDFLYHFYNLDIPVQKN